MIQRYGSRDGRINQKTTYRQNFLGLKTTYF